MTTPKQLVQTPDFVNYVMEFDPIRAINKSGSPITSDQVPGFQFPEKIESLRSALEIGIGIALTFVLDPTIVYQPAEKRRMGSFVAEGITVEVGTVLNMMTLGFNPETGKYFDTYKFQVGMSSDGVFSPAEPNNNNPNPFKWTPAAWTAGGSSSLTYPLPHTPEQWTAIEEKLKAGGWVNA